MSQIGNSPSISKLGNTFNVNMAWVNNQLSSSWSSPVLTIGSTSHNLLDLLDNVQTLIVSWATQNMLMNNQQLRFTPLDWLRANVSAFWWWTEVSFGLPLANRNPDYVLTRNWTQAVRAPACDPCCEQIRECMQPIIDNLQNQINNLTTLIASTAWWPPEDFTVSAVLNPSTNVVTFTRILWWQYTVDLSPLISSFSDNYLQNVFLTWTVLNFDMVTGPNITVDLSPLIAPTIQWRDEGVTVVSWITAINFIGAWVVASSWWWWLLNVTIPWSTVTEDVFVKIRASDTTPSYLFDSINNSTTLVTINDWTIQKRVVNPWADESLQLVVNLSLYIGDTQFVGNHTQTGNTTITWTTNLQWPVNIWPWPLTYTNTVTTGNQIFNSWYTGNYNQSTLNFSDETQFNFAGDLNFLPWNETTGTQNFMNTYIGNYADESVINMAGDFNWLSTSEQVYQPWSTITGTQTLTNLTINGTNVDATYDNTSSFTYNWSTINNNGITENWTGNNIINLPDWASITNNLNGDVNNNYWPTYTENNNYANGSTINNTGNLTTNNNNLNHTINNTNSTFTTTWWTYTYNNITENFSNITQNFNDTPDLIGCVPWTVNFWTAYTYPTGTQFIEVVFVYNSVSKTIRFTPDSWTHTHLVNGSEVAIVAWPTTYQYNIISWTISLWSITSSCAYNWVSTNNYENKIHNHEWDITNNTNTYETNTGVTNVYDSNSTIINQWTTILQWDTIIEWDLTVNQWAIQFNPVIPTSNITGIYPLPAKPTMVFKNWLYMTEWASYDYIWNVNQVEFTTPTALTDQIVFL